MPDGFSLAEAYVEFSERGLSETEGDIRGLRNSFDEAFGASGNFRDELDDLDGGFSRATGSVGGLVTKIGALVGGLALGATVREMFSLATAAETSEVKFRVLLQSADAARDMIGQIDDFAARTPFQKLGVTQATQQLIAFNVPAGEVFDHLKAIGDIAALTGNDIGELSEIYGKANVAGTLFAEDINQLVGRGIPVIQEFAKQFNVSESEVKGLASQGKITADNLARAFQSMTSEGGQFADGMAQLSETTEGKLSTLKDNAALILTDMAKPFLPLVNTGIDALGRLTGRFAEFAGPFMESAADRLDRFIADFQAGLGPVPRFVDAVFNRIEATWTGLVRTFNAVDGVWQKFSGGRSILGSVEDAFLVCCRLGRTLSNFPMS